MCYMRCTRSKCAEVIRGLLQELYNRQAYLVPCMERELLLLICVPCVPELHRCAAVCVWFVH
jgi:hypothetical protein